MSKHHGTAQRLDDLCVRHLLERRVEGEGDLAALIDEHALEKGAVTVVDRETLGARLERAPQRIVYSPDAFFRAYPRGGEPPEPIQRVRAAFGVAPWTDPRTRLEELRTLEGLLEAPPPAPPEEPMPSAVDFWERELAHERARPEDERDPGREAHMEQRLADARRESS
jgi:hypothetical protein